MSCEKADAFLTRHGLTAGQVVDAKQERFEGEAALQVLRGIDDVLVMRGAKSTKFTLRGPSKVAPADLLPKLLGPTGNLRAPTLRLGKLLMVGFAASEWESHIT